MAHSWQPTKPHYGPLLDRLDYTYKDSRIAESRFGSGIALYFWFFRFLIQVTLVVWYVPPPALPWSCGTCHPLPSLGHVVRATRCPPSSRGIRNTSSSRLAPRILQC
jgi:hypothetical protein